MISNWFRIPILAGLALLLAAPATAQPVLSFELDETRDVLGVEFPFVLRTTSALPLSSLEFAVEVRDRDGFPAVAFASLVSATAFAGDAVVAAEFDAVAQRLEVTVTSASATLNEAFGPIVALRFALDPSVAAGDRFVLPIDPGVVALDAVGEPVRTAVGQGRLRIVDPEPGQGLAALGGELAPGDVAVLGAVVERPFAIGSGTVELFYDAALFDGEPVVAIDPRYGSGQIDSVSQPEAGHLLVTFHSPDGDLNSVVHGAFLTVVLPIDADAAIGTLSDVLVGAATVLFDPADQPIALETDGEVLEIVAPGVVARAFFEEGGFTEWWLVVD